MYFVRRCVGVIKGVYVYRDGDGRWGRRGGFSGVGFFRIRFGLVLLVVFV